MRLLWGLGKLTQIKYLEIAYIITSTEEYISAIMNAVVIIKNTIVIL
jgi:hypothetical protein